MASIVRTDQCVSLQPGDHDLRAAPQLVKDRPLGAGGMGLQLTQTFAVDTGWYTADATKHVWASFPG